MYACVATCADAMADAWEAPQSVHKIFVHDEWSPVLFHRKVGIERDRALITLIVFRV